MPRSDTSNPRNTRIDAVTAHSRFVDKLNRLAELDRERADVQKRYDEALTAHNRRGGAWTPVRLCEVEFARIDREKNDIVQGSEKPAGEAEVRPDSRRSEESAKEITDSVRDPFSGVLEDGDPTADNLLHIIGAKRYRQISEGAVRDVLEAYNKHRKSLTHERETTLTFTKQDLTTLVRTITQFATLNECKYAAVTIAIGHKLQELQKRLTSAENRASAIRYCGLWNEAESYKTGSFITFEGALWHAEIDSTAAKPDENPICWKLAVERGHDGKDADPTDSPLKYRGVWSSLENYSKGAFVSHGGSMWHAEIDSVGVRPDESESASCWRLAVKRGRDGKDAPKKGIARL